jgi:transcriptional regulator with XRE-family HTH domain
MHLGRKIKIARVTKGLTQQELADKIGKTRPLVSSIEQTGKANYYTLLEICKVLNLDAAELQAGTVSEDNIEKYQNVKQKTEELTLRIERLLEENKLLKELVESQKQLISQLQKRSTRKKNKN